MNDSTDKATENDTPTVLLVGGPPRSGTTLLTSILNQNPKVALLVEYDFSDFMRDLGEIFKFGDRIAELDKVHDKANEADFASNSPAATQSESARFYWPISTFFSKRFPEREDFHTISAAVIRAALGKPGASVIGAKAPLFMTSDSHLVTRQTFEKSKYLFSLRNPLSQANSSLNRRNLSKIGVDDWHIDSIETFIVEYVKVIRSIAALSFRFPEDCYSIKYEDLVQDQQKAIDAASTFLEIPPFGYELVATAERGVVGVLSDREEAVLYESLGSLIDGWDELRVSGCTQETIEQFGILFPSAPGDIKPFTSLYDKIAASGWSLCEDDGAWSDGGTASLVFGRGPRGARWLRLKLAPYIPRASGRLRMRVCHNGRTLFDGELISGVTVGHQPKVIACPIEGQEIQLWLPGVVFSSNLNVFDFAFSGLVSPSEEGVSSDSRKLGIKLQAIGFPAADVSASLPTRERMGDFEADRDPSLASE